MFQSNAFQRNFFQLGAQVAQEERAVPTARAKWSDDDYRAYRDYWERLEQLKRGRLTNQDVKKAVIVAKEARPDSKITKQMELALAAIEQDKANLMILQAGILEAIASIQAQIKKDLQLAEKRRIVNNEIAMILLFA